MVHMLKDCLPLQDKALQTPIHSAATKLITGFKSEYYEYCLEQMVAKAVEIPGKTAEILNAQDQHGNTALHYLAQNELGFVALRAIVNAGGDISIRNKKKLSPLDIAMNNGSTRIIKILSTAVKNSRHSSRYDSNVYTTDSPPASDDEVETSKRKRSHVDHSYSLAKDSSLGSVNTPGQECMEEVSFDSNASTELEASDLVPSGDTEDEVPPCDSAEAHSDTPNDAPTGEVPPGGSADAQSNTPNDAPSEDVPPGGSDEAESDTPNDTPSEDVHPGGSDEAESDTPNDSPPEDVPPGGSAEAQSNTPNDAPSEDVPPGGSAEVQSNTPNDAPSEDVSPGGSAEVQSNTPNDVPSEDMPSGDSAEAQSDTPNDTPSEDVETTPSSGFDELPCGDECEDVDSGDERLSDCEDEPAHAACRCNAKGVQTPVIDPYSCIVHIKQEILSPVSVICYCVLYNYIHVCHTA